MSTFLLQFWSVTSGAGFGFLGAETNSRVTFNVNELTCSSVSWLSSWFWVLWATVWSAGVGQWIIRCVSTAVFHEMKRQISNIQTEYEDNFSCCPLKGVKQTSRNSHKRQWYSSPSFVQSWCWTSFFFSAWPCRYNWQTSISIHLKKKKKHFRSRNVLIIFEGIFKLQVFAFAVFKLCFFLYACLWISGFFFFLNVLWNFWHWRRRL